MPRAGAGWQFPGSCFLSSRQMIKKQFPSINLWGFCGWEVFTQGGSVSQGCFFPPILLYWGEKQITKSLVYLGCLLRLFLAACWSWGEQQGAQGHPPVLLDKSGMSALSALLAASSTSGKSLLWEGPIVQPALLWWQCWDIMRKSRVLRSNFRWTPLGQTFLFPFPWPRVIPVDQRAICEH